MGTELISPPLSGDTSKVVPSGARSKRPNSVFSGSPVLVGPLTMVAKPQGVPGAQPSMGRMGSSFGTHWAASSEMTSQSMGLSGRLRATSGAAAAGASAPQGPQQSTESPAVGPAEQGSVLASAAGAGSVGDVAASWSLQASMSRFGAAFGSPAQRSSSSAQSLLDRATVSAWASPLPVSKGSVSKGSASKATAIKAGNFCMILPRRSGTASLGLAAALARLAGNSVSSQ